MMEIFGRRCVSRGIRLTAVLVAALVYSLCSAAADQPTTTITEPGYRPPGEHAAGFIAAVGNTSIDVLPSLVRRAGRTAHSFSSQQLIAQTLGDSRLAVTALNSLRIDMGMLERRSQWDLFQRTLDRLSLQATRRSKSDYMLAMEFLVPDDNEVFGIHVFIVDRNGNNAFSFILNAHHRIFVEAALRAADSSESAREAMLLSATRVGLEALQAQIRAAKRCADYVPPVAVQRDAGLLHDFEAPLGSGQDEHGIAIGFSAFSGPRSTVRFQATDVFPARPGAAGDNTQVLQVDLDVADWGGVINRFAPASAARWEPQDWRGLDGLSVWFYGQNSGAAMFLDIFDNRRPCSTTDDAQRFRYRFFDDVSGWRELKFRFSDMQAWNVGNNAPEDRLDLDRVHGWGIGTTDLARPLRVFLDDMSLLADARLALEPGQQRIHHRIFWETRLSETSSRIEFMPSRDSRSVVEKVAELSCELNALAEARDFSWYRITHREQLAGDTARFQVTFYNSRPSDAVSLELPERPSPSDLAALPPSVPLSVSEIRTFCEIIRSIGEQH